MSVTAPSSGYTNPYSPSLSQQASKPSAAMPSQNTSSQSSSGTSSANDPAAEDTVTSGGLRAQIKVNGVVVGMVYNNGVTVMNNGYAMPGMFGGSDEADLQGPQLADYRLTKLQTALQGTGAEFTMLPTAITADDWFATLGRHVNQTA